MSCNCKHKGKGCVECLQCHHYNFPELSQLREMSEAELIEECSKAINICRQLNTIIEFSSDSLFITNGEGRIIKINAAYERASGIPRTEIIGKNVSELVGSVISESCTVVSMAARKTVTIEQTLMKSGRSVFVTSSPIYNNGVLEMIISNNRDFNEIEALKIQLAREQAQNKKYLKEITRIKEEILDHHEIIAKDKTTLDVLYRANKVAKVDSSVLIAGETGTGKEEFAKYIHCESKRKDGPFIRVNCGAIANSIMESEFFGYEKGAFTGANSAGKQGLFEIADGGTLFLDEIGELPPDMQVKLLRVLQEHELLRVGGTKPIKVDVRILAATNRDLKEMMQEKMFREDLYYRLSVVTLQIPALRNRPDDIVPLAQHFLESLNQKYELEKTLTRSAFQLLKSYCWPGNVRELKNVLEEVVVMSDSMKIERDDFAIAEQNGLEQELFANGVALEKILDETELKYLHMALNRCGSIRKAAGYLHVTPTTYARRLKLLGEKLSL